MKNIVTFAALGIVVGVVMGVSMNQQAEDNVGVDGIKAEYLKAGFVSPEGFSVTSEARKALDSYVEHHGEWKQWEVNGQDKANWLNADHEAFDILLSAEQKSIVHDSVIGVCGEKATATRCTYVLIKNEYEHRLGLKSKSEDS